MCEFGYAIKSLGLHIDATEQHNQFGHDNIIPYNNTNMTIISPPADTSIRAPVGVKDMNVDNTNKVITLGNSGYICLGHITVNMMISYNQQVGRKDIHHLSRYPIEIDKKHDTIVAIDNVSLSSRIIDDSRTQLHDATSMKHPSICNNSNNLIVGTYANIANALSSNNDYSSDYAFNNHRSMSHIDLDSDSTNNIHIERYETLTCIAGYKCGENSDGHADTYDPNHSGHYSSNEDVRRTLSGSLNFSELVTDQSNTSIQAVIRFM